MRTTADVLAMRLDEADATDHVALKDFARLTAQRLADRDRVRSVVGVKRTRRDFGAALAGLPVLMATTYTDAFEDK